MEEEADCLGIQRKGMTFFDAKRKCISKASREHRDWSHPSRVSSFT